MIHADEVGIAIRSEISDNTPRRPRRRIRHGHRCAGFGAVPTPGWDSDALKFYEVVDGKIVENPPMGAKESVLASFLQGLMGPFASSNGLGRVVTETLFLIDRARNLKRRPDLAFISASAGL